MADKLTLTLECCLEWEGVELLKEVELFVLQH